MKGQVIATITVKIYADNTLNEAGWDKLSDAIEDLVDSGDIEAAVYDLMPRPLMDYISLEAKRNDA